MSPMEQYILVAQTRPKPPRIWLLFLYTQDAKERYWGQPEEIVKWKGTFGLTNQN